MVDHYSLVRVIAIGVQASMPKHVELDDLIHAGVIGLMDAASKFDPAKEVKFPNYAKHRIRGAILDDLRKGDWASRTIRKRHNQLSALNLEVAGRHQRTPTEQEIAERMSVDVPRCQMAVQLRIVGLISATQKEENETMSEYPAPASTRPDKVVER